MSLAVWTIASAASSQASSVQATPSSATGAVPAWQSRVALQVSAPSQNRPLSQLASLVAWTMMSDASSQASSVQPMPSLTAGAMPGWQSRAASQVSTPSQKRPSSQCASLGVWTRASEARGQGQLNARGEGGVDVEVGR
jgi:hypothetical protein